MTRQEVWMDVKLLHRQGASVREIARRTGLSRVTVRKILTQKAPKTYGPRSKRPSLLEPYLDGLSKALDARPWVKASVLHRELAEQGFAGHYHTVRHDRFHPNVEAPRAPNLRTGRSWPAVGSVHRRNWARDDQL